MQTSQHLSTPPEPPTPPEAPVAPRAVPVGGSQVIIDKFGDRTVFTSTHFPPEVMSLARGAERTAFGLMGLLAVIVILGPFARMVARRSERRAQMSRAQDELAPLLRQIEHLQQSVDTMSVEIERISESQRFQSKLLFEGKTPESVSGRAL